MHSANCAHQTSRNHIGGVDCDTVPTANCRPADFPSETGNQAFCPCVRPISYRSYQNPNCRFVEYNTKPISGTQRLRSLLQGNPPPDVNRPCQDNDVCVVDVDVDWSLSPSRPKVIETETVGPRALRAISGKQQPSDSDGFSKEFTWWCSGRR